MCVRLPLVYLLCKFMIGLLKIINHRCPSTGSLLLVLDQQHKKCVVGRRDRTESHPGFECLKKVQTAWIGLIKSVLPTEIKCS